MTSPLPHQGSPPHPVDTDEVSVWQQRCEKQLAQFTEDRARFMEERASFIEQRASFAEERREIDKLNTKVEELNMELIGRDNASFSDKQSIAKLQKEISELRSSSLSGQELLPSTSQSSNELSERKAADVKLQTLRHKLQELQKKNAEQKSENKQLRQEVKKLQTVVKAGDDMIYTLILAKEGVSAALDAFPRNSQDAREKWGARFQELIEEEKEQEQGQE